MRLWHGSALWGDLLPHACVDPTDEYGQPLWGAPRIHGELLKLGFEIAQSSVAKYMVKRRVTAGVKDKSAHGLREAAATRAVENGATAHELMAIFGWIDIKEAEIYTRAADRKRLAAQAMSKLEA
jgi:integrase